VNVSSAIADAPFPCVSVDDREVGRLAIRHLRDRGFRHFGFVGHPRHFYTTARDAGFRELVDPTRDTYDFFCEHPVRSYSYRRQASPLTQVADLQRWLQRLPRPAGVFACHGVWGVQVLEACHRAKLHVPDDIGIICVDSDDLLCEQSRPSLSSMKIPSERIGFEAGVLLDQLLNRRTPAAGDGSESSGPAAIAENGSSASRPAGSAHWRRMRRLIPPVEVIARQSTDVLAGGDHELTAAVQFIRLNAHRTLEVKDVLRAVPASRRSLERRFRTVLQRGIAEEIRRVHLERAKSLLSTTMLSIGEVARQAGFASVHYLSRTIRQATGQTPTAFRRQFYASSPGASDTPEHPAAAGRAIRV